MKPPLSLAAIVLLLAFAFPAARAAEDVRTFPASKCRVKLPGPGWNWRKNLDPDFIFEAVSPGMAFTGFTEPLPPGGTLASHVLGFETQFFLSGRFKKRGGRNITYKDLPAYQVEIRDEDGSTMVCRIFLAHGLSYHLNLNGGKEPVENDPRFEAIMDAFDFTERPVPPPPPPPAPLPEDDETTDSDYGRALNVSAWMGRIVGVCLILILVLLVVGWLKGKTKSVAPSGDQPKRAGRPAP